jgi:hypothetical protein
MHMKYLMLIIGSAIFCDAKAQLKNPDSLTIYNRNFHPQLHNTNMYAYNYSTIPSFSDNSVLKIPSPILTYNGNNNSFNIYQSTPDNMPLAKPDSTIAFNMPVKK